MPKGTREKHQVDYRRRTIYPVLPRACRPSAGENWKHHTRHLRGCRRLVDHLRRNRFHVKRTRLSPANKRTGMTQRSSTLLRRIPDRGHRTRSQASRPNRVAWRRSANRRCKSPLLTSAASTCHPLAVRIPVGRSKWMTPRWRTGSARASLRMFHVKLAERRTPVAHESNPVAQAAGRIWSASIRHGMRDAAQAP
jgi:hypothetical protein